MRILRFLEKWIFISTIFLIPSQLAYHFWPSWSFVYGLRVDYLSPAVYLTDVLIIILLVLWCLRDWKNIFKFLNKRRGLFFAVALLVLVNTSFSSSVPVSIVRWAKILEFVFFGFYISTTSLPEKRLAQNTLFISAVPFSLIGIAQFFKGATLGGIFYFLGERTFILSTPGIALTDIVGKEYLRAYSTFSHPNSLAGFLGVVFLMLVELRKRNVFKLLGFLIMAICFVLTFSLGAYIAFVSVLIILFLRSKKKAIRNIPIFIFGLLISVSLFLPIVSKSLTEKHFQFSQTVAQRLDLSSLSGKMISERFWIGEGLNTYTVNIPRFRGDFSYQWLLQPVHNIFLLIFAELGIVSLLVFCLAAHRLLSKLNRESKTRLIGVFLFILITGLVDHYWLTLQQNILLLSFAVGVSLQIRKH